ncbi:hypothetical protein SCB49_05582 [unidentified eubacterium SCB49]|nr:hypothetical protein SCB49_05582 [unidentified eubacterium SCB49]
MKKLDLLFIEQQLKHRWDYKYVWKRKQNDLWDAYTSYIYKTQNWEDLIPKMAKTIKEYKLDKHELFYYASNRWYNFWSAMAVEQMFTEIDGITPAINNTDKEKDFFIHKKSFDHKTSIFPKGFGQDINYSKNNKLELITWLYQNQSSQKRFHLKNRLFIIVHNSNGQHWKLKAELSLIKNAIQNYMNSYHEDQLQKVIFAENKIALSDIIWVQK